MCVHHCGTGWSEGLSSDLQWKITPKVLDKYSQVEFLCIFVQCKQSFKQQHIQLLTDFKKNSVLY